MIVNKKIIFSEKQKQFLWSREYISKQEYQDLLNGYTTVEVLLDPEDEEEWNEISNLNSINFIKE